MRALRVLPLVCLVMLGLGATEEAGPAPLPGAESPPVNTIDPLTGLAVDPGLGTVDVVVESDPLAGVRDPDEPDAPPHAGDARVVHIGCSSPESRETVRMADAPTRQRYARAALAGKAVKGGLASSR